MKVGDLILVTGPGFFEKSIIKEKKSGVWVLDNGIQADSTLKALNSKYKLEVYDEDKYKILCANRVLTRGLDKLQAIVQKGMDNPSDILYAASKVQRILDKIGK